jgi:hypothetical protein
VNATAPQVDGLLILDQVLDCPRELTEYIDINNDSWLLALTMTGQASRHNAARGTLWKCRLAHVGLKALEIVPKVAAATLKLTSKCICKS